jgi:hypothetical protein
MKHIQNIVAESHRTLPITAVYAIVVWLMAGLINEGWWLQFGCFVLSVFLMMQMNSQNLLTRIYSRTVSVSYMALICTPVFLFHSVSGALLQICSISALLILFSCYQDNESPGRIYYTFLLIGIGGLINLYMLLFIPLFWILMAFFVYAMGWRTWFASLIGLLTPFWFTAGFWLFGMRSFSDLTPPFALQLPTLQWFDFSDFSMQQALFLAFILLLIIIGSIHFIIDSIHDKIRVRQLYYAFMFLGAYSLVLLFILPHEYDMLIRVITIAVSPLIGHFFALTHSKFSNMLFFVIVIGLLAITSYNLWMSSSLF